MSIENLEEIKDNYYKRVGGMTIKWEDLYIKDFMQETINTFKNQSDEIASLRQQLAQNPDYLYVPRMEGTDGVDNIR